mgnify:CR=1 FL=1
MKKNNYQKRLLKAIPGGAHTYSRGYDQYPSNAPEILTRGKGAYVYDSSNRKYLDYGMALRAINIGYSEKTIDDAAIEHIKKGNNLTKPSLIELQAAELLINTIDSVDMVKFTKNGSTAVSAAVKLARAHTGKELIARCRQHPFFSYDDWFIGSTSITKGIPRSTIKLTKFFNFNDIDSIKKLILKYPDKIACIVLEPATSVCPTELKDKSNFLKEVQKICNKNNIVFILDEMITGFRWHLKGAQHIYGIKPDISTFGKAMANGFSVSCVAGRREIMQHGSIEFKNRERTFLLSTTHGAEMSSLAAFIKTVHFLKENDVIQYMWDYGDKLKNMMNNLSYDLKIDDKFIVSGPSCSPVYDTKNNDMKSSLEFRTLFSQEMIAHDVLMPFITLCYRHRQKELKITERAVRKSLEVYKKALDSSVSKYLKGDVIKPVFRKYN